jgi:hypothetical protein
MLALGAIVALVVGWQVAAFSLTGSNFEIDEDANLVVDNTGKDDWESIPQNTQPPGEDPDPGSEIRGIDLPTGSTDDSYQGGVKEDTVCPGQTTGSIPNNKSDLRTFHVNEEAGTGGHPGFLNLGWSRVTDPSGTTLMDFEFNQSSTKCTINNSPNVQRTQDDLLIEYLIDQGGARAEITARFWQGDSTSGQWGAPIDLDEPNALCPDANGAPAPCAEGTINSTAIPEAEADGIDTSPDTELAPRTFGEAQIDLRLIFQEDKCVSFGSAMLKSRSSDSFTSQPKDFIAPQNIDVQNCGKVIIRKETDPVSDPATTQFGYTKSFGTDPASANTFTLGHGQSKEFNNVLFGSGYTITEDVLPAGWDFQGLDCSASGGVEEVPAGTPGGYTIDGKTVTFDIDDENDVLDCTYTNRARGTIIVEKITTEQTEPSVDFSFTSQKLGPFTLTTTAAGDAGKDSETFSNLIPGTFDVAETELAGWNLVSKECDDGSAPESIDLSAGETVTCTFTNSPEKGALKILKNSTKGGAVSQAGAVFSYGPGEDQTVTDNGAGDEDQTVGVVCVSGLAVGDYTVNETTPPPGYGDAPADEADQVVTVVDASDCGDNPPGDGATATFTNPPLADIQVRFKDGGSGETKLTAAGISCTVPNGSGTTTEATDTDGWKNTETVTGVKIDPSPQSIQCTIPIDP